MQVCCIYAGKSREDSQLEAICKEFARGLESQGHSVDIFNMNIDQDRKLTFYDYVNALRIEKMSIPLLVEHPEYTLDYIAKQSGFNSLSTFRRAFRKQTGTTPGNFRKKRGS